MIVHVQRIEKTVFLSYRRTNVPWALAISQSLAQNGFDVFFDFTGIASGDFAKVIIENIKARAHFIVLLTPSALDRCDNPEDWLRKEIETAIETRRNIVPLTLEGFDFATPRIVSQLTGPLAALKSYNALSVPAEYFPEAMARLREKYLNVPLHTVLHPASESAQKAARMGQAAAMAAPPVTEEELTAQQLFERGFYASDIDEKIWYLREAVRLNPDPDRGAKASPPTRFSKRPLKADQETGKSPADYQRLEQLVQARTEMLRHAMEDLEHSYDVTLEALGDALDLKDFESEGHSKRVTAYTIALARAIGLPPSEIKVIARGAFLHDIGKLATPDKILRKKSALTQREQKVLQEHCARGYQMLRKIPFLREAAEIVYAHQEHHDGSGYPNGLKRNEIPIGARIFAVADALDAITTDRPYRKAFSFEVARKEILRCAGSQFDPMVVEAFLRIPTELWRELRSEIAGRGSRRDPRP